ncbi:adenosylcobinamide hydrolase [Paenibacillus sp. LBL]|uniref:adenosylcobinamide amidohydrolase n=1 Tax=Paenibacillus sp. LBL TaxID=2940563 RepID=UPI002473022F|nr:adenosylcobinamide amidohydrolase [Paenibacillus sp. LBL]MDH6674627.1 adenosylcobinamide hydrolase [Paenibacillus sp. LBL]
MEQGERNVAVPFLTSKSHLYRSEAWPGTTVFLEAEQDYPHIRISLPDQAVSLSSAIYGGGFGRVDHLVNRYVNRHYDCSDPVNDMFSFIEEHGYPAGSTAGLMTAVKLKYASIWEERGEQASILCCATAGVGNAARAGSSRTTFAAYQPGTINIMLLIDGMMTPACMVNAVLTATEAKAAALHDLGVKDHETGAIATGTTTDAIVLGVSGNPAYGVNHHYAGTATDMGGMIGQLVYRSVTESIVSERADRI